MRVERFKRWRRCLACLLAVLLLCGMCAAVACPVNAATAEKTKRSYEIAIVFDNSGSMYMTQAWCRAKYAMEIFASMLNYDNGDSLSIFPMWEVVCDGSQPSSGGSYKPIKITNKNDIDKISNMYTTNPLNTPFAPITEAYEFLKTSDATDKWMVILTDGEFNEEERKVSASIDDLQGRLLNLAKDDIYVQYLGFDKAAVLQSNGDRFFAKKSSDTSLKDDLVLICNQIFQRSPLAMDRLNGKQLTLDLSMKNLIVFAQGSNAMISGLTADGGKAVDITLDSGQRTYSEIRAAGYETAPVDDTLAGQVVTFAACDKGTYTLEHSGADDIQIFYEPNVDIQVTLTNADGETVDPSSGQLAAGDYTVTSKIIDRITGEDVTNHTLMGTDVSLKTYVKTSSQSEYTTYENGSVIGFVPDSKTELYVEATYLKDYKLSTKDDSSALPLEYQITVPAADLQVKTDVTQPQAWYTIKDHESWKPIKVSLTLNSVPLTEEEFAATEVTVAMPEGVTYRQEALPAESAYVFYLGQNESGEFVQPPTGTYTLKTTAVYTDSYGTQTTATDTTLFDIQLYSAFWRILFWILLVLLLVLIWLFIMTRKVLPKRIDKDFSQLDTLSADDLGDGASVHYNRKAKTLEISTSAAVDYNEKCDVTFKLRAVDNRFTRSKDRAICIVGVQSSNCSGISINHTEYREFDGVWGKSIHEHLAEMGRPIPPIEQSARNPLFKLERGDDGMIESTLICKVKNVK